VVRLYTFGPALGLPDPSPFVLKTMLQLGMAAVPFETHSGLLALMRAPKGRLPYLRDDDGTVVADSAFIRDHIERTRGVDLDAGHDARERALGWALEKMLEDNVSYVMAETRWLRPAGFAAVPANLFRHLPRPVARLVAGLARRRVRAKLDAQGTTSHTEREIDLIADRGFQSAATLLGDKPYLFGTEPAAADATLAAFSAQAAVDAFPGRLRDAVVGRPSLIAHRDRMLARFAPSPGRAP
jgi:glutathione S-transferase